MGVRWCPQRLTHAVHGRLSNTKGGWLRTIGYSMMQEGLAITAAMRVTPGYPERDYLEFHPGWLAKCREKDREILAGIRPFLADSSNETLSRFIFGAGSSVPVLPGWSARSTTPAIGRWGTC